MRVLMHDHLVPSCRVPLATTPADTHYMIQTLMDSSNGLPCIGLVPEPSSMGGKQPSLENLDLRHSGTLQGARHKI